MARKLLAFAFVILATSTLGLATAIDPPDFTGNWAGSMTAPAATKRGEKNALHAAFKQAGSELSGTLGPSPEAQLPISKGRVEATKFGTVVTFELAGPSFVMQFELRPDDGTLRGLARIVGEKGAAPIELQPAK